MPKLIWDAVGERGVETGVEKGVLYLEDGTAVVWNGLVSVSEKPNKSLTPIYFDGIKTNNLISLGDFSATISAYTFPEEMTQLEGYAGINSGVYLGDQKPETFSLSYRTLKKKDDGSPDSYKIHLIYNATAIASDKNYSSVTDSASLTTFQWTITAVPEEFPGHRPSAHIIFDSAKVDPVFLADLELLLYGGDIANPSLPSHTDLLTLIAKFLRVEIVDNKDGTWTARTTFDGYIFTVSETEFLLKNVNAEYLDADTYRISDTRL